MPEWQRDLNSFDSYSRSSKLYTTSAVLLDLVKLLISSRNDSKFQTMNGQCASRAVASVS